MNEQNFDKIFGDKLNEGIDFNFTEQKWGKMEKNLDAFHTANGRKHLLLWLLLPLLSLIGLLTWSGWLLHNAQQNISELKQEVHALRLEKQLSLPPSVPIDSGFHYRSIFSLNNDTVYHHVVVKRYDTIFQTVVRRELVETTTPSSNFNFTETTNEGKEYAENDVKKSITTNINDTLTALEKPISTKNKFENELLKTVNEDSIKVFSQQKTGINGEKKNNLENVLLDKNKLLNDSVKTAIPFFSQAIDVKKMDSLTTKPPLDVFSFITTGRDSINDENDEKAVKDAQKAYKNDMKLLENKENEENVENSLEKQKRSPIIKPIKIAGYEWGVLGGFATINRPNTVQQNGFSVGAKGGILLGERWKIVGETQYLFLSYETDKITPDLDIKIITPPTVNDSLDGVKVKQPYWQYALGVQYALSEKRLKPFIGINLLGQSKLQEEFEYEYVNTFTNTPVFVQTVRREKSFQVPFMRLQLGATYPLFGKINAQMEGSYDVKLGNSTSFKPLWQVKTGFLYRF